MYIYIYIYICMCIYIYTYTYKFIYISHRYSHYVHTRFTYLRLFGRAMPWPEDMVQISLLAPNP